MAVDDLLGSRLVNAEVIFAIDFEIRFLRRLKVKSSAFVWLQKISKEHVSRHWLVLHLTGFCRNFDFSGRLIFQSSRGKLKYQHFIKTRRLTCNWS